MYRLTGNTFEWKKELKQAGFKWNSNLKSWDATEFSHPNGYTNGKIIEAIESGELVNIIGDGAEQARRSHEYSHH